METSLEISWSAEFVDEVRRCQPMQAFVYEDGEFEVNPFLNLQPMELTKLYKHNLRDIQQ